MGAWNAVPYELQSPTWRNAANYQTGQKNTWDPKLNLSIVDKFASAFGSIAPQSTNTAQVTASVDGGAQGVDWLRGLTGAVLAGIGARSDTQNTPQVQPVSQPARTDGGVSSSTLALIAAGAVAVGVIYYASSK